MLEQPQRVTIVDIDMSMQSIFWLMLKWAIAAIPAMVLLTMIGMFGTTLFILLFGGKP